MTGDLRQQITNAQSPRQSDMRKTGESPTERLSKAETLPEDIDVSEAIANSVENETVEENPFPADLERKFTRQAVILYVEQLYVEADNDDERYQYYIHAHNAEQVTLETEPTLPPKLSFSQHMNSAHSPRRILGFVRAFSEDNPQARKLRGWLIKLQQKLQEIYNEALSCLMIIDRTDFEIPWEMVDLKKKEPIGASIAAVRWQDLQDPDIEDRDSENQVLSFSPHPIFCRGEVVAYTNKKELKAVEEEIRTLNDFKTNRFEDVNEFLDRIDQVESEVGLIFVASHGLFKDDMSDIALGEQQAGNQQISLMDLYTWDFNAFRTDPTIVFLNACHSGRLSRKDQFNVFDPKYRKGFATFFLERGAKGVVGTLGKVGDRYAAQIAQSFFAEYRRNPNLTVAEILRNLRADIARKLQAGKSKENWYLFLYTFMYVYYGNPKTVLEIAPAGGQAHV